MSSEPTSRMPTPSRLPPDEHRRLERILLIALAVAYLGAGAVIGFSVVTLLSVSDQIHASTLCQRIR